MVEQRVRRDGRVVNSTANVKGSKSKGILMNQLRYPKTNTQFPDAIQKNKHIMALMRDNKTWELAIIMEVRCKPPPDSDDEGAAETTQSTDKPNSKLEEVSKSDVKQLDLNHHRNSEEGPKKEY